MVDNDVAFSAVHASRGKVTRFVEPEPDMPSIRGFYLGDPVLQQLMRGAAVTLERELHILGGHRITVVKFDPFANDELVDPEAERAIIAPVEYRCQRRGGGGSGTDRRPNPRSLAAVRILLRADAGFAREGLMRWCELNGVDYLFGLARNARLTAAIAAELEAARQHSAGTGRPARRFKDFMWSTLDS